MTMSGVNQCTLLLVEGVKVVRLPLIPLYTLLYYTLHPPHTKVCCSALLSSLFCSTLQDSNKAKQQKARA